MKTLVCLLVLVVLVSSAALGFWMSRDMDTLSERVRTVEKRLAEVGKTKPPVVETAGAAAATGELPAPVEPASSAGMPARVEELEKKCRELEEKVTELSTELAAASSGALAAGAQPSDEAGSGDAKGKKKKFDFGEVFGEVIGESMREQALQEKQKILSELAQPTVEGEEERQQNINRSMEQLTNLLGLNELEQNLMRDILDRSDKERRDAIGTFVLAGKEPTYDEVKQIIDNSYKSQDAQVANVLVPERLAKYERQQRNERRFVNVFVKLMFQEPDSGE